MTEAVRRQLEAAGISPKKSTKATGKGKTPAGGRSASSKKKTSTGKENTYNEGVPSTEPVIPQPRYYLSTTVTEENLHMARLVGFTAEQWTTLEALLKQQGFRPY